MIIAGYTNLGVTGPQIFSWNGSLLQPLGSGMSPNTTSIRSLTVYNGHLIAGGSFTTAGGQTVNGIARWNGVVWQPIGTGVASAGTPGVGAVAVYNNELIAAGNFTLAGGNPASRIARWRDCDMCLADITPFGGDDQVNIDDLLNVLSAWGPCPLQPPACPPDIEPLGGDGVVNIDDLELVLFGMMVSVPGFEDVNLDGVTNMDDLLIVINGWGACPPPPPPVCP